MRRSLKLSVAGSQAGWVAQNYITDDTEALDARANQAFIDAVARTPRKRRVRQAWRFRPTRRQLNLLKLSLVMATPAGSEEAEELTQIISRMRGHVRQGQVVPDPAKPEPA